MDDPEQHDPTSPSSSVGYRRPPAHTRFKKGQSGNPKGRRRGSLNLSTLIEKELDERVTINENGARKRITKKQAIAKQIVNKAAGGDHKVIPILINDERLREGGPASTPTEPDQIPEEDQRVMASLLARIRSIEPISETETCQPASQEPPSFEAAVVPTDQTKDPQS